MIDDFSKRDSPTTDKNQKETNEKKMNEKSRKKEWKKLNRKRNEWNALRYGQSYENATVHTTRGI